MIIFPALIAVAISSACPSEADVAAAQARVDQKQKETDDAEKVLHDRTLTREQNTAALQRWSTSSGDLTAAVNELRLTKAEHESCMERLTREATEEAQRAREREAQQTEEALAAEYETWQRTKPKVVQLAVSANRCYQLQVEKHAMEAIKEEKAAAKIAGVVDLAVLHSNQQQAYTARKIIRAYDKELRDRKLPALSCRDARIREIASCMEPDEVTLERCSDPDVKKLIGFVQRYSWSLEDI